MHFFRDSQNFVLNNAQFTDKSVRYTGPSGIDILREASNHEAAYDSSARQYAATCFPGTREQYMEDITRWVVSSSCDNTPVPVYWMKGPAGVGKSAIAQTCAERVKDMGYLGASFFFSINGSDDHTRFFPSIAYQLAIELPEYREIIDKKVYNDNTLVKKTMKAQFKGLIAEPLQELGKVVGRKAIFVDGLDECRDKDAQCEIVDLVANFVREVDVPLFWAFFSRSEPHLQATFAKPDYRPLCNVAVLPISREADEEIELYLRSGLRNILTRRNIVLSYVWPSECDLKVLVTAAAGLFIYPAIIIRFIDRADRAPEELLRLILGSFGSSFGCSGQAGEGTKHPFAELDAFYTMILRRIPEERLRSVQLLLALALMTPFESCVWGIVGLSNMLGFSEGKFRLVSGDLHAVLHFQEYMELPSVSHSQCPKPIDIASSCSIKKLATTSLLQQVVSRLGGVISFHHKSFYDFLGDPTRSGSLCVSTPRMLGELFKLRLGVHLEYTDTFSIQDQDLVEAPNRPPPASVLSWPHHCGAVNSYIKAATFNNTGFALLHAFYPYDKVDTQLIKHLVDFDFQKHLLSQPLIFPVGCLCRSTSFGLPSLTKFVFGTTTGTVLSSIPPLVFHLFNTQRFYEGITRLEKNGIIRQIRFPNFMKRRRSFHGDSRGKIYERLYKKGHGDKKTFWYWELNLEMGYYREFETNSLAEGSKVYGEEDFKYWVP